jgi:hypothetical protein
MQLYHFKIDLQINKRQLINKTRFNSIVYTDQILKLLSINNYSQKCSLTY